MRLRSATTVSLLLLVAVCSGCNHRRKSQTVVVHLLRNLSSPYGSELDRRILDFQGNNPRLSAGQPITVESETGDYQSMVDKENSGSEDVDLIILDKAEDAKNSLVLQNALAGAPNVCAALKACPAVVPAIIPPQISGDSRQAAQKFVDFLQQKPS